MGAISKIYDQLLFGMAGLSGVLIFFAFVSIVVDVLMRITGLEPFIFIMTMFEYILLWFTMLAAPYLLRIKGHVFIDAVTQFLPPAVKTFVAKLVYLLCITGCCIYGYNLMGLLLEAVQSGELDMRTYEVPIWLLFVPMPLCFFMCVIEFLRYLFGVDDMYSQSIEERENV
ncbi:MAG: TRAP transporter small permease subunit [Pseudomonadota bacterium]|nr:TRAP transporter small permease subunit [Pseudomonadota bacterium]